MTTRSMSCFGILAMVATLGLTGCPGENVDPPPACAEGETDCNGFCYDTARDIENCGGCNVRCGTGYTCEAGTCVSVCAANEQFCGGACIDPTTDRNYCGAADCPNGQEGDICAPNYECRDGGCACDMPGYTECGPGLCYNLDNEINSCGECGIVCDTANGASCINGVCRAAVTYAGTLVPQNGRWEFGGEIGLPAGDAECEANWPNSTVCTAIELIYAGEEGQLAGAVDTEGNPVVSWWNNDDEAGDDIQCVYTTMENVRWSYPTAHVGNGGSYYLLQKDGTLSDLQTTATCPDEHAVACCNRAIAID